MMFRCLTFIFLTFSLQSMAVDRKPAVEDFVGIEVEHPMETPQGTEGLFNFEKDYTQYSETKSASKTPQRTTPAKIQEITWSLSKVFAIILAIGFPTMVWFFAINNLRRRATQQNASNIEVLEKYRRERELAKKSESFRKSA